MSDSQMATDILKLVEYGCTVQRGSNPKHDLYVVVDVDGKVVADGHTVDEAMHRGVFKIETGEDPVLICEHGSMIGDWCKPCNEAYKQAIRESEGECINCHQIGNECTCDEYEPWPVACVRCKKHVSVPSGKRIDGFNCPYCGASNTLERG